MNLEKKINGTIKKYGLLQPGDRVLLGVSGGRDSVALLHLLFRLAQENHWRLGVAHLDHGVRGAEALQDAEFVEQLAKEKGLPFYLKRVALGVSQAGLHNGNLEARGRQERYDFFCRVAAQEGYNKVATAHTRNDQAETVLLWLLRGSGRRGMGGMPAVRALCNVATQGDGPRLVRPFIEISRDEITRYLEDLALTYRSDETNSDCRYLRNWVRHRLLPRLETRLDGRLTERLGHLSELWREEEGVLNDLAASRLSEMLLEGSLTRAVFLQEGKAMQRRLIRCWFSTHAGNLFNVGFDDVEVVLGFIHEGPAQGRLSLPGGWELHREYERLWLQRPAPSNPVPLSYRYLLPRRGKVTIREAGVEICSGEYPYLSGNVLPENESEAVFDCGALPESLVIRNFRAGDRFRPLGMEGRKKVKDLFIEKKIPLRLRRTLPLVLAGEEILWIPRLGRSDFAKTGPQTLEILRVRITANGQAV